MRRISTDTIKRLLASASTSPAVTIYAPTHTAPTPPHLSEDRIRFKNLFHAALEKLDRRQDSAGFRDEFRKQCEALLDDRSFWEHQSESLLICARPGEFAVFHLPIEAEEYVAVDDYFHLAPIMGLLHDLQTYYVLILGQQDPALLEGDIYDLRKTAVKLPKNVNAALNIDEMVQEREGSQFHSISGGAGAEWHGHGGAKDAGDAERLRFFRMIDDVICARVDTDRPLLLAGVESEIAEYRDKSRYPNILPVSLSGSYNHAHPRELFPFVRQLISEHLIEADHLNILDQYAQLAGNSPALVSDKLPVIEDAADEGRIDTLIIGMSRKTADTVQDGSERLPVLSFPDSPVNKSLDYIARRTWQKSGSIINLYENRLPGRTAAMAIFRY